MNWITLSLLTLIFWGTWGFFLKLGSLHLNLKSVIIYDILGNVIIALILMFLLKFKLDFNNKGFIFSLLAGISVGLGSIFFVYALTKGKTPVIVALTALYPAITILLACIFLKEQISPKQILGIITASVSFLLLAM